ncbi:MAG: AEC family transporter [Burkholderiaceae bacterium]|nr:AEC family transporter [Burkholderiaceae bacterium]
MLHFSLLLPDLITIALGFILFRSGFLGREVWDAIEKLVYFVLFPSLLFVAVARSPLNPATASTLIMGSYLITMAGILWAWLARWILTRSATDRLIWSGCAQTAFRFNSYVALSLASRLDDTGQATALYALVIGFNVPICNAFAVIALAGQRAYADRRPLYKDLASNPLIIATTGGLLFKLFNLSLPELAWISLSRLGQAALILGLLAVGAGLNWAGTFSAKAIVAWMLLARTLILPLLALSILMVLPLDTVSRIVILSYAALPTASSAYILAARMGAPAAPVAAIISIGTLLSTVTLPGWIGFIR